jgi:hypothetical protein
MAGAPKTLNADCLGTASVRTSFLNKKLLSMSQSSAHADGGSAGIDGGPKRDSCPVATPRALFAACNFFRMKPTPPLQETMTPCKATSHVTWIPDEDVEDEVARHGVALGKPSSTMARKSSAPMAASHLQTVGSHSYVYLPCQYMALKHYISHLSLIFSLVELRTPIH